MKVTKKYCRDLLAEYEFPERDEYSGVIDEDFLKGMLQMAKADSRFHVSFDQALGEDAEDTWDVIGPGAPYGHIYASSRDDAEETSDILNKILRRHFGPRNMEVKYTPEAHRSRVLLGGKNCCPVCGSEDVSMNEHFFRESTCSLYKACHDCGGEWKEIYVLHEYKDLKND